MARSNGVSVCGIMMMMMMMMIMGAAAQAPAPSVDCQAVVLTLTDCLGFVSGTDKTPPAACCNELSAVVKSTPQCLCLLFNTTFTGPLGLNVTRAQELPPACKVQTPSTSLCALVGVPVPSPASSSSPVVAPAPAAKTPASSKAPTPALAPASLPTAPSPIASSPSTTAPSPTASPPSSTTAAPGGSVVPSTNIGSPSPSSAPAIISWNAAVAASLLLASIFLS